MGTTKIEWADKVWNPVVGCTPVSEGCRNCYAKMIFGRFHPGESFSDVKCLKERLEQPFRWKKPSKIFVNSMSDLFHEEVNLSFIGDVLATIRDCPQHKFMVLTKRISRVKILFAETMTLLAEKPLPNLWLGVSVEDQKTADERIQLLLQTPATVRFVSVEPMLGAVDIEPYLQYPPLHDNYKYTFGLTEWRGLDWVICGGESGPGARPMHPAWAQSLRDQCQIAGVPFFFKKWGNRLPVEQMEYLPAEYAPKQRYLGKSSDLNTSSKKALNLLDGEKWEQFPEANHE